MKEAQLQEATNTSAHRPIEKGNDILLIFLLSLFVGLGCCVQLRTGNCFWCFVHMSWVFKVLVLFKLLCNMYNDL